MEARAWEGRGDVNIRLVDYIDHAEQLPGGRYNFSTDLFGFKHVAYEFEKEVRVVVSLPVSDGKGALPPAINVPVNPNNLIRSLVVAPGAGDWFVNIVTDLATKYGIKAPVRRSELTKLMRRISRK